MNRNAILLLAAAAVLAGTALFGAPAAFGATTTVFCKANENPCKAENIYPEGTAIKATAAAPYRLSINTSKNTIRCLSTIEATVGSNSGASQLLSVNHWKLGENVCTSGVEEYCVGPFEGEKLPYSAASTYPTSSLKIVGPKWHLNCGEPGFHPVHCTYSGSEPLSEGVSGEGLTLALSGPTTMTLNGTMSQSGTECWGTSPEIHATFTIESPKSGFYVSSKEIPGPPIVTTQAASGVTSSVATLNAKVNSSLSYTYYHFEYDTTEYKEGEGFHGTLIPFPEGKVGADQGEIAVAEKISGLTPATTYHYRIVAANSYGVARGKDMTFTTRPETVLCKASESSLCSKANRYPAKTSISTGAVETATFELPIGETPHKVSCGSSQLMGETSAESGDPLPISLSKWTMSECKNEVGTGCTVTTEKLSGSASLLWSTGATGELTVPGSEGAAWKIQCAGWPSCTYSFEPKLTVAGGTSPHISVSKQPMKVSGGFLCEGFSAPALTASYPVSSPKPSYVAHT